MRFLRWGKGSLPSESSEVSPSWRSRLNPFSRSTVGATMPTEPLIPVEPQAFTNKPVTLSRRPSELSGLSEDAMSPTSSISSRALSMVSTIGPNQSFDSFSPNPVQRQPSVYSHRAMPIRRDDTRPVSVYHAAPRFDRSMSPRITEDDCLVLTATVCFGGDTNLIQY